MKKLMVLCVLGLAVLIVANNETFAKPQEQGVKKCNDGRDNDDDGLIDSDDPGCQSNIMYTAARTIGVLSFDAVVVTPNGTESDLFPVSGTADLKFFRPGMGGTFDMPYTGPCLGLTEVEIDACDAWDAVIENCDHLRDSGVTGANVPRFTVKADNLSFGRGGGVRIRFGGIEVLDAYPVGNLFMGLHLELIGECFNTDGCTDTFLPAVGDEVNNPRTFILTHFWLTGHTEMKGKKGHCNRDGHEGSLVNVPPNTPFSNLVITAEAVEE